MIRNININESKILNAICENDIMYFKDCIKKIGINFRLKSENNDTLLMYAISDSESEIYKYFIKNNADLLVENELGENVLHSAIYSGKLERIDEIIDYVNINKTTMEGTTPLLLSIGLEYENIATRLIEKGADINYADSEGNSPLHLASFFGLYPVVKILVEKGAKLNSKTKKGNLPLALAVNQQNEKIVKFLYKSIYISD